MSQENANEAVPDTSSSPEVVPVVEDQPVEKILQNQEQTLSELLAVDRTALAHERTFLAYIRTSLTALIAGVSLIKLFNTTWTLRVGWSLTAMAVVILLVGLVRLNKLRRLRIQS